MADSIHARIVKLFEDDKTDDAARTLDEELMKRLEPIVTQWSEGCLASYEFVTAIVLEACKP